MTDLKAYIVIAAMRSGAQRRATVWATTKKQARRDAERQFPNAVSIVLL